MRPICRLAGAGLLAAFCAGAFAAGDADEAIQRQRIARKRAEAEARYTEREAVCRERFIVTACIDAARADRRDTLDRLQRQEEALDGQERRRRAAARLTAIREKTEALERPRAARAADPSEAVGSAAAKPDAASATGGQSTATGAGRRASPGSTDAAEAATRQRDAAFSRRADDAAARRRAARAEADQRRATVREAAAARAAVAEQRRQESLEADRQRAAGTASRKSGAPLPARPAIPPASNP